VTRKSAEIQAAGERLAWETEVMLSGAWVLLDANGRAVKTAEYDYATHGPMAHCWHCKRPTGACSWIQNPNHPERGDCCESCEHTNPRSN
jgi:hypothetical protein